MAARFRRTAVAAGVVTALLLLSGCVSIEGRLSLDGQARASGTVTLLLSKQFAAIVGITSLDALSTALEEAPEDEAPDILGGSSDYSVRETDTDYAIDVSLQDATLDDEESMVATVNEAGDQVTFAYTNSADDAGTEGLDLSAGLGRVTLEVDFPGPVVEASGAGVERVDDDTVRWDFPLTESTVATATSEISASAAASGSGILVGVAAASVLAVVVIGLFVRRSRSQRPAVPGGQGPGAGAVPGDEGSGAGAVPGPPEV